MAEINIHPVYEGGELEGMPVSVEVAVKHVRALQESWDPERAKIYIFKKYAGSYLVVGTPGSGIGSDSLGYYFLARISYSEAKQSFPNKKEHPSMARRYDR